MSSFLAHLVARQTETVAVVEPRPVARFEERADAFHPGSAADSGERASFTEYLLRQSMLPAETVASPTPPPVDSFMEPVPVRHWSPSDNRPNPQPPDQPPPIASRQADPSRHNGPEPSPFAITPPDGQTASDATAGSIQPVAMTGSRQGRPLPSTAIAERLEDNERDRTLSHRENHAGDDFPARTHASAGAPPEFAPIPPRPERRPILHPEPDRPLEIAARLAPPRAERLPRPQDQSVADQPVIHVTIGRVEIRAQSPAVPPQPRHTVSAPTAMPLSDYLARRRGAG